MTWFAWDEISNEIVIMTRNELDEINSDGGWELEGITPSGVHILFSGRHYAMEVELDTDEVNQADLKFTEAMPYYVEMQEE